MLESKRSKFRLEKDLLGQLDIPAEAYYGIQTFRALQNFSISGIGPKLAYTMATVHIKLAAAKVNRQLGLLAQDKADAIITAAKEVLSGKLLEWIVVDIYQAGAGTSHNMNVNEVLANRAIEILGGRKGEYHRIHPNDDVNMAQSTNDVIPTAIRIAAIIETNKLLEALKDLQKEMKRKSRHFDGILKSGRTHLQDAVPMRLGQEFGAWEVNIAKHHKVLKRTLENCKELGIGGTAVGTGLNSHINYRPLMVKALSEQLIIRFKMVDDYFEAMQSMRPFVELSGAIRNLVQDISRISNDLRLLSSGPKTGFAEIQLPAVQPGSSIIPGKVNPVIAEMLNMVCFQVIGCDTTILWAGQAGQLELNVMMPVIAYNLLQEIEILTNALIVFTEKSIKGIKANEQRLEIYARESVGIGTILNPILGYHETSKIVKKASITGKTIQEILLEDNYLTPEEIEEIFSLENHTYPRILGQTINKRSNTK
jgi:aspartate ammonia-lyase